MNKGKSQCISLCGGYEKNPDYLLLNRIYALTQQFLKLLLMRAIQMKLSNSKYCIVCQARLSGRQKKYCSAQCKNQHHQSYHSQKKRGLSRKLQLVYSLGGRCSNCGYAKKSGCIIFSSSGLTRQGIQIRYAISIKQEA